MMSLAMGMRQCLGLFLPSMTKALEMSASDFTFAIAVQNIVWGLVQAPLGAMADRWGVLGDAGLQIIDMEVNRQAAMIAYLSDFQLLFYIILAMLPLVLLIKPVKMTGPLPTPSEH